MVIATEDEWYDKEKDYEGLYLMVWRSHINLEEKPVGYLTSEFKSIVNQLDIIREEDESSNIEDNVSVS